MIYKRIERGDILEVPTYFFLERDYVIESQRTDTDIFMREIYNRMWRLYQEIQSIYTVEVSYSKVLAA